MNEIIRLIFYCILWVQCTEAFTSQFATFVAPPSPVKLMTRIPNINPFVSSSTSLSYNNLDIHEPPYVLNDSDASSRVQQIGSKRSLDNNSSDLKLENLPRMYYTQTKQRLNQEILMNIEMAFGRIAIIGLVVMILHKVISQCSVIQ